MRRQRTRAIRGRGATSSRAVWNASAERRVEVVALDAKDVVDATTAVQSRSIQIGYAFAERFVEVIADHAQLSFDARTSPCHLRIAPLPARARRSATHLRVVAGHTAATGWLLAFVKVKASRTAAETAVTCLAALRKTIRRDTAIVAVVVRGAGSNKNTCRD